MPAQQQKIVLRCASRDNSAKASDPAPKLAQKTDDSNTPPSSSGTQENATTDQMALDISKIYALLKETSEKQDDKLNSIQASTRAVEAKLADLSTRLVNVESRIAFLEDANTALEVNPPASRSEVENLLSKLDDLENRSRRNNLRFVGFPEGCEDTDALAFMCAVIPELLKIDLRGDLELERAHRTLGKRKPDGQPPRAMLVRFLRFQDREKIVNAARSAGKIHWKGHHVMIFPDYSKLVTEKREAFRRCKQLLHERKIAFSLKYPAVLVLKLAEGYPKYF
ncbi:hypothetical protein WMY93_008950 [Mugilogobius chulae]|uniref:L1 transposable element RRM domain-containing protein n=1 Tax=Mugilogobius chulae TaxID=88201 RepID=A0AAW0PJ17_9GOBI